MIAFIEYLLELVPVEKTVSEEATLTVKFALPTNQVWISVSQWLFILSLLSILKQLASEHTHGCHKSSLLLPMYS